jgi:hypothetical protein
MRTSWHIAALQTTGNFVEPRSDGICRSPPNETVPDSSVGFSEYQNLLMAKMRAKQMARSGAQAGAQLRLP